MNKVISIEIAKQVFWIEDAAYQSLQDYLANIREQLATDDCGDDIYQDIELRIAELLYELAPSDQKAITVTQLRRVIEQVGYIESTDTDDSADIHSADIHRKNETKQTSKAFDKKSYLDPSHKIVAGVCSGLSIRFKVPAFVLRLVFLGLSLFFGLGLALYIIFWISLDKNASRHTALAAKGKARTANELANAQVPKESAALTLQRILFLPFSIIGTLISVIGKHFQTRKKQYAWLFKNVLAVCLFVVGLIIFAGMLEFNSNRTFHPFFGWLLGFSVTYLIVLGLVVYIKEFYAQKPRIKVDKSLKLASLIPVFVIAYATYSLNSAQREYVSEAVSQQYEIDHANLELTFIDNHTHGDRDSDKRPNERIEFRLLTSANNSSTIDVTLDFYARGKNLEKARENIEGIDYQYSFDNDKLLINLDWSLNDDFYMRSQKVVVTLTVPNNIVVKANKPLVIDAYEKPVEYALGYTQGTTQFEYYTQQSYLHEWSDDFPNKLSENELTVLQMKFCDEFFIGERWGCTRNITSELAYNYRFDKAFKQDEEKVKAMKEYLKPNRSLFVSNLDDIQSLLSDVSVKYQVKSDLAVYIEHLQKVKAQHVESIVMSEE